MSGSPGEASLSSATPLGKKSKKRNDFRFGPILGKGTYSTVVLAREKSTGKEYAMKILPKAMVVKEKKVQHVRILSFHNLSNVSFDKFLISLKFLLTKYCIAHIELIKLEKHLI